MKAVWNDRVIAEASADDLIRIEGNWYFPSEAIKKEYYAESEHRTTCFWKGEAHYYDIAVEGRVNEFGAWYYPYLMEGASERVKKDFSNYVAFWNGVQVTT